MPWPYLRSGTAPPRIAIRHEPNLDWPHVDRYNDGSGGTGFWGGSAISGGGGICSSAFAWRSLDYATSYMLTAGHCYEAGGSAVTVG